MKYILGIDLGTQSIKISILDENLHTVKSVNISNTLYQPSWDCMEEDPREWWEHVCRGIAGLLETSGVSNREIEVVGMCGIMHTPVPIGHDGRVLGERVQIHSDKRCMQLVKRFEENTKISQEIWKRTANVPATTWTAYKIKWIQENQPELYKNTWKFLAAKDFLVYQLTGNPATDFCEGYGTGLMEPGCDNWSREMAELIGINLEKMPDLVDAVKIIGRVDQTAAKATGLLKGTPVVMGTSDMHACLLTTGLTEPGSFNFGIGTAAAAIAFTKEPLRNKKIMNLRHVIDGWTAFAEMDCAGGSLRWFKDMCCEAQSQRADQEGIPVFALLDSIAAESPPGANNLLFFPYLLGERNNMGSPYCRGSFIGLGMGHRKADMLRAVMEGVALEGRRFFSVFEECGFTVSSFYSSGGGGRSEFWNQVRANVLQKELITVDDKEQGILGAALIAGHGIGMYPNLKEAATHTLKILHTYEPDKETAGKYEKLYQVYKRLHDQMCDVYKDLANC